MTTLISTVEQLKKYVKLNANMPFESIEPFLQQARDLYLVRYLGLDILSELEGDNFGTAYEPLLEITRKALAPLALWIGNSELSVRISDSGFTVAKQDGATGYLPASDTKIAQVEASLRRRAVQYIDKLIEYLETNISKFPKWKTSPYYLDKNSNYLQTASQFQELGLVDIMYSRLVFESLKPTMSMIDQSIVTETIGGLQDAKLRSKLNSDQSLPESELIATIRKFVASKTVEIQSDPETQRRSFGSDKKLVPQPYTDFGYVTTYHAEQAIFYLNKIKLLLVKYATELGVEIAVEAPEFNADDKRIFNMMG